VIPSAGSRALCCTSSPTGRGTSEAGTKIEALVAVGADVDARFTGPHSQAARQFPHAQVIDVPNAWHGPEREATGCALSITSDFIRNQRLGDTSCLAKIPSLPVK
jgi:hypothetical protein